MSLNSLLNHVLYEGGALATDVPYKYHVGLGGYKYLLDLERSIYQSQYEHQSINLLRAQGDAGNEPAESSINPEDFWRRGQSDWTLGAGQTWLDKDAQAGRVGSSRSRFRSSKGIDIWTDNQISLLYDTDAKSTTSNTNMQWCPAGARVYQVDGQTLKYTTDPTVDTPTFTAVTGTPAATPGTSNAIASDGYNVWVAYAASGIYNTNTGSGAASQWRTGTVSAIAYVKGRLMCSSGASIYDVSTGGGGALPTALFTQANTDFSWVGFAEGKAAIYAAGCSGDKSLIYRIGVKPDGSALDLPIVAGELPDGETVTGIGGYLGFIFVGTSKGVRFAEPDAQGNLTFGAPFGPASALCFEGQDRFMWFGWTNYDGTSTGLGRCDLTRMGDVEKRQPAYASDLMATAQGAVRSVISWNDKRYFTVSAVGSFGQHTNLVASGTISCGLATFGLPEDKVAVEARVRFGPSFAGTVTAKIASDLGTTFSQIGSTTDTDTDLTGSTYPIGQVSAETFEMQFVLARSAALTTGPNLTRWTLRAEPAAGLSYKIIWPLILADEINVDGGTETYMVPETELARIKAWHASREVLTAQEGTTSYPVMVSDYDWRPTHPSSNRHGWNGTCTVELKVVS